MAKKRKGRRRGMLGGVGRKVGSFAGTAVQLFGVLHGVISGVSRQIGDPKSIPRAVVYDYSGVNIDTGAFDQAQAIKSGTIILVTYLVGRGIKYVARRL